MTFDETTNGFIAVLNEIKAAQEETSSSGKEIDWAERIRIVYTAAGIVPVFGNLPKLGNEIDNWTDEDKAARKANFVKNFSLENKVNEQRAERIFDLIVEMADFAYDWIGFNQDNQAA